FLARTEVDRMDSENKPGKTPVVLEPNFAYAVALGVDRGWGEQLAGSLCEILEIGGVYGTSVDLPVPSTNSSTALNLFNRNQ
ncbi:MAG: hypothetical protein ACRD4Y_08660, partial [Candidatus Acidiferrales bacterium]